MDSRIGFGCDSLALTGGTPWAKSHPLALRSRVIAFVEEGHSHRAAARHFRVSPNFVNNLVKLKRATGSLAPRRQGHLGGGKLNAHGDWVRDRLAQNDELTLDELGLELAERGVIVHRSNVGRHLHRLDLSHKKSLQAGELWIRRRFGYRRLFILLKREGEPSGVNRIYRLHREEGLSVRKRKARRRAVGTRAPILVEAKANARWSLDFVHDQFACGRRFRVLNILHEVTRDCLAAIPTPRSPAVASHGN